MAAARLQEESTKGGFIRVRRPRRGLPGAIVELALKESADRAQSLFLCLSLESQFGNYLFESRLFAGRHAQILVGIAGRINPGARTITGIEDHQSRSFGQQRAQFVFVD